MKYVSAIILCISLGATAFAQHIGGLRSAQDPFTLNETGLASIGPGALPLRDTQARSPRATQSLSSAVKNCVFFSWGQSNGVNTAPTAIAPTNIANIDNLNIYDGGLYAGTDPLLGPSYAITAPPGGGHYLTRLADSLISAGKCDRVVNIPFGINASAIADWDTGTLRGRVEVAVKRAVQRGIQCGTTNVYCVMLVTLGETDCSNGTSTASYVAGANNVITRATAAGFSGRWLFSKQSYNGTTACSAIQNAQTQNSPTGLINNGSGIYLGANADALTGSVCSGSTACRQGDGLHFSDNGNISFATDASNGWQQALHASGAPF